MNPRAVLLVALVVLLVIGGMIGGVIWLISRSAGVRRKEFQAMADERNNALTAIFLIEDKVRDLSDLDHPLATSIRTVLREHDIQRRKIIT